MPIRALLASSLALLLPLGIAVPPATASDGVIEIGQDRALAGGITVADSHGFPVTIGERGSYRLTSNLVVPGGIGISITVNDVTIDLNGFSVVCVHPTDCSFSPPLLPIGILAATGVLGTTVRNGLVRGFFGGVWLQSYSLVERVTVVGNSGSAIVVAVGAAARDSIVTGNVGGGISSPATS